MALSLGHYEGSRGNLTFHLVGVSRGKLVQKVRVSPVPAMQLLKGGM